MSKRIDYTVLQLKVYQFAQNHIKLKKLLYNFSFGKNSKFSQMNALITEPERQKDTCL